MDLSTLINSVPTRYSDIDRESNSVIDLIFLCSGSTELNNHSIHPSWHLLSNYAPLMIIIFITEEFIASTKLSIPKGSEEVVFIRNLNTSNIMDNIKLENLVNLFRLRIDWAWEKQRV